MSTDIKPLELFARLTRAAYSQQTGRQAPPWNHIRQIQRWFDPSPAVAALAPHEPVQYRYLDQATGIFKSFAVTAAEARTPNLPGLYDYPKYVIAPTMAVLRNTLDGSETGANPAYMCERAEAEALAVEIGAGEGAVSESGFAVPWVYVWRGETRRMWVIAWGGGKMQASQLLAQKNKYGLGAPGQWELSGVEPVWIPGAQGDAGERDPRPEVPIPVRELDQDEELVQQFGGKWVVRRVTMTAEDWLRRIDAKLDSLLTAEGRLP